MYYRSTAEETFSKNKQLLYNAIIEKQLADLSKDEIWAHFTLLEESYFKDITVDEIELHLTMIHKLLQNISVADSIGTLEPHINWQHDHEAGTTTVTVVTWDRFGLFYKIAGAFAMADININSAKVVSRSDHIAIDVFTVNSASGGIVEDELAKNVFNSSVTGMLAFAEDAKLLKLEERKNRRKAELSAEKARSLVRIYPARDDKGFILELEAFDEVGLLYLVSKMIYQYDFDIQSAGIATDGGRVIDAFHISSNHKKLQLDDVIDELKHEIEAVILDSVEDKLESA